MADAVHYTSPEPSTVEAGDAVPAHADEMSVEEETVVRATEMEMEVTSMEEAQAAVVEQQAKRAEEMRSQRDASQVQLLALRPVPSRRAAVAIAVPRARAPHNVIHDMLKKYLGRGGRYLVQYCVHV